METLIKLPSHEWFIGLMNLGGQGNIYTGSYGTEPYKGCLCGDEFRYRVWVEKDENGEKLLKAVYYVGSECFDVAADDKKITREFEASTKGINEAQNWLCEELDGFIKARSEN